MTVSTTAAVHPNDIVTYAGSGDKLYRVMSLGPKNAKLIDEAGKPWVAARLGLKLAPAGTLFTEPVTPSIVRGTVVRFVGAMAGRPNSEGLWVCVSPSKADGGMDQYVRLNGDGVSSWKVLPANVEIVEVS